MDSGSFVGKHDVRAEHHVTDAEWKYLCNYACGWCKNLLYCSECVKFHCGFGRSTLSEVRCKRFVRDFEILELAPWESIK